MRARFLGKSILLWINLLTFLLLFAEHGSCAEFVVSIFSGVTSAENNDLRLRQSGGTDLTFHDVSYKTHDWQSPIYYGGRVAYFPAKDAHWGVSLEFFHAKMYLNTEDTVRVTGTRAGAPVDAPERVGDTITDFNISHGLNFLTANAMYRWFLAEREMNFLGRFQPYLGAGLGAAIPHVESTIGAVHFEQYQFRGPACQAMGGLNFDLSKHLGLFAEYKFTYADLDRLSIPNGSISLTPLTHHLATGISVRF